jgi:membrane-associated phospholipid phosphatase
MRTPPGEGVHADFAHVAGAGPYRWLQNRSVRLKPDATFGFEATSTAAGRYSIVDVCTACLLAALTIPAGPAARKPLVQAGEPNRSTTWLFEPAVRPAGQVPLPPPKGGRFKFLQQVGGDFKHFPSWDTAAWLAAGGGLSLAAHPADDKLNARLAKHRGFFSAGRHIGSAYVQAGTGLVAYVVGRTTRKERVKHLGTDLLSSQIVAQAITQAIKISVRRDRPDHSNKHSFPSGHASSTFASATVLQRHLGWKAALPTYTIASYVAISRMHENRHHLSDVVFGAALGIAAGRTTTRHGREHWTFVPTFGKDSVGLMVVRNP